VIAASREDPRRISEVVAIYAGGDYKSLVNDNKPKSPEKGKSSFKRIKRTVAPFLALWLSLAYSEAAALEIWFEHIEALSDSVGAELAIVDSLPDKIVRYIDKGMPVGIEYRIELWRVRAGWFDSRTAFVNISYRVRYDTWSREFSVFKLEPDVAVEYTLSGRRETFDLILSSDRISLPLDDSSDTYYLVGKLAVKVMTLSNFKEVESWLKGEISEAEKPNIREAPDKLGEFFFNTALKVTGLENASRDIKTDIFRLKDLPMEIGDTPE